MCAARGEDISNGLGEASVVAHSSEKGYKPIWGSVFYDEKYYSAVGKHLPRSGCLLKKKKRNEEADTLKITVSHLFTVHSERLPLFCTAAPSYTSKVPFTSNSVRLTQPTCKMHCCRLNCLTAFILEVSFLVTSRHIQIDSLINTLLKG